MKTFILDIVYVLFLEKSNRQYSLIFSGGLISELCGETKEMTVKEEKI